MRIRNRRRGRGGKIQALRLSLEKLDSRQLLAAGNDLAFYEFTNHSTENPELFSSDTHVETTASDISSPLPLGWTGNGEPPRGLALGGAFNETTEPTPAGGQTDYFEFTVTPDPGYLLNTSRFSMQIRRNDPDSKNSYSVYFDNDPGPGGNNFTTKLASGVITSEDVFERIIVDVEGMPEFVDQTTALTIRVYAWGTSGLSTMRLDNIRLQAVQETTDESKFAYYGDSGRLINPLDAQGNRVSDFSAAGYRNSNEPLPDVTQTIDASRIVTVSPIAGDDMANIQAAIDQVGNFAVDADGYRGVVQLTAGEFEISNQIRILDSGVVLRGVGDGSDPQTSTILRGTGTTQRSIVVVGQASGFASGLGSSSTHNVVDKYVPAGATSLRVDSTANWSVGDPVIVDRQSTAEWISSIGMDNIPPRSDGGTVTQWAPGGNYDQLYERVITRIEGDRVFFNAPIMHPIQQEFGGATVWRYTFPRINNVGIENIRGVSDFNGPTDEAHARTFIELQSVQDAWVRNVTGQHFIYATVHATSRALRVTVDDAESLDPVSIITGARRYPFTIDGQFVLMRNLYSEEGRHDFVNNSAWRNRGPNVFLDGVAVNSHSSTGPHQRYATGTLYDTITTDNLIEARNRGNFGSGHGWAGAGMVFWNARGSQIIAQNPQGAQNWVIGSTGTLINETRFGPQPPATVDAHGTPIDFDDPANPTSSLFVAQRNQRMAEPTERREYVVGDFDLIEFDGASSADALAVDPNWLSEVTAFASGQPVEGSDQTTDGQLVPFTFDYQLDQHEVVRAATLSLGLRGTGGSTSDDQIWFEQLSDARTLSSLGWTDPVSTSETQTLTWELTGADLNAAQDGQLNLLVGENLALDWATLDLQVLDIIEFDFGDAPAPYPTLVADDGARHAGFGPQLGATRTIELNGNPDAAADGETDDGVMFGEILIGNPMAGVNIELQNADEARVDAWIDFDGDGEWETDEKILDAAVVFAGLQTLNYDLPADAPAGNSFARVRLSSVGGLTPTGFHFDGEVEDYAVTIGLVAPPEVEGFTVNGGDDQRSTLDTVAVQFDSEVELTADAFQLRNRNTNQSVSVQVDAIVVDEKTVANLTFLPGPSVEVDGSLSDGNYELVVMAAEVSLGGRAMSGDVTFGSTETDAFFRHYGDSDGDRDTDGLDYGKFAETFLRTIAAPSFNADFDFDGDDDVDGLDYAKFGERFLRRMPFV